MAPKQDPKPKFQEGESGPGERHLTAAGRARRGGGAAAPSEALCRSALRRGSGRGPGGALCGRRRSAGAGRAEGARARRSLPRRVWFVGGGAEEGARVGGPGAMAALRRRGGGEGRGPPRADNGRRSGRLEPGAAAWGGGAEPGGAGGAPGPGSRAVKWPPQDGRRRLPAPTSAGGGVAGFVLPEAAPGVPAGECARCAAAREDGRSPSLAVVRGLCF